MEWKPYSTTSKSIQTMEWNLCSVPLRSIPFRYVPFRFAPLFSINPNRALKNLKMWNTIETSIDGTFFLDIHKLN